MSNEKEYTESSEVRLLNLPSQEVLESVQFIPCGKPYTYGATPCDHPAAHKQQTELLEELYQLVNTDVDEAFPLGIREYMNDTFAVRFTGRATANFEKYLSALAKPEDYEHNPLAYDMIQRARIGHASPAELILVRQMLGMSGIELACVSHPYGKRIEEVAIMRQVVRDSIITLGGTPIDGATPRYRVKGVVNEPMWEAEYTEGFLMTRKRNIGIMPDGTIIRERTSFILRADIVDLIPEENLEAIRMLDPTSPTWQTDVVKVGGLDAIAAKLLEDDAFTFVIPVSSTIYAFNPDTTEEIEQRRAQEKLQRKEETFENHPALNARKMLLLKALQNGQERDDQGMILGRNKELEEALDEAAAQIIQHSLNSQEE